MKPIAIVCALLGLGACGFTDAGEGSGTLFVVAEARYNAGDNTRLTVQVEKNGQDVADAKVVFTEDGDDLTVPLEGGGDYRLEVQGYRQKLELRVESGDDWLSAKLEGPGPHTIDSPRNDEVLKRNEVGDELEIKWSVEDGIRAEKVSIRIEDDSYDVDEDDGSFDKIPTAAVASGSNDVRLRRTNSVLLEGGTPQSIFEIHYDVDNEFVLND